MRAKTSEFLKVLNRAKIEEENTKKKTSFMGNRGQFIWKRETIHLHKCKTLTLITNWFYFSWFSTLIIKLKPIYFFDTFCDTFE